MSSIIKSLQYVGLKIASMGMTIIDRGETVDQNEKKKIANMIDNLHNGLNCLRDLLELDEDRLTD